MKIYTCTFMLFLVCTPAIACKMTSKGYEMKALALVKNELLQKKITVENGAFQEGAFEVRAYTNTGQCKVLRFKIEQYGNCKMNSTLLSEIDC